MKRMIDDGMLDTAAKSFIKHYEGANAPADAPSSENSYFTSIKVAKAKAGARRSINRTIRICAVAAALMIGLVCALFMGAENDDKPMEIHLEKQAYMWKNNDPESAENMPVVVSINLKEDRKSTQATLPVTDKKITDEEHAKELGWTWNGTEWETGVWLKGNIIVRDTEGTTVKEYSDLEMLYAYEYKWIMRYTQKEGSAKNLKSVWYLEIIFNDDFTEFEIFFSDEFGRSIEDTGIETLDTGPNMLVGIWMHRNATFITSSIFDRQSAIDERYNNAERVLSVIDSEMNTDRIKNKAWK